MLRSAIAVRLHRKIARWIVDHILWDTATNRPRAGFWRGVWATRKLLVALAGAGLLTRLEWVEHHPPDIAIVAILHFVFMLSAIALLVYAGGWFGGKKSPGNQANGV